LTAGNNNRIQKERERLGAAHALRFAQREIISPLFFFLFVLLVLFFVEVAQNTLPRSSARFHSQKRKQRGKVDFFLLFFDDDDDGDDDERARSTRRQRAVV
jgi:hypothetical protein